MPFFKVAFEFELESCCADEAANTVLGWFGDGMCPVAEVTEVDENYESTGSKSVWVDLEEPVECDCKPQASLAEAE